jgi:hypothetical protein
MFNASFKAMIIRAISSIPLSMAMGFSTRCGEMFEELL